jgi:hypothetical protein
MDIIQNEITILKNDIKKLNKRCEKLEKIVKQNSTSTIILNNIIPIDIYAYESSCYIISNDYKIYNEKLEYICDGKYIFIKDNIRYTIGQDNKLYINNEKHQYIDNEISKFIVLDNGDIIFTNNEPDLTYIFNNTRKITQFYGARGPYISIGIDNTIFHIGYVALPPNTKYGVWRFNDGHKNWDKININDTLYITSYSKNVFYYIDTNNNLYKATQINDLEYKSKLLYKKVRCVSVSLQTNKLWFITNNTGNQFKLKCMCY